MTWTVLNGTTPVTCTPTSFNGSTATCAVSDALGGTYSATAVYSGDTNYTGSTSSADSVVVATAPTATGVTDTEVSASQTGTTITFTATVTGEVGGISRPAP